MSGRVLDMALTALAAGVGVIGAATGTLAYLAKRYPDAYPEIHAGLTPYDPDLHSSGTTLTFPKVEDDKPRPSPRHRP